MRGKRGVGAAGEFQAEQFLRAAGLTIIEKNFLTKLGEVDLIAQDKEEIVFVEVKYRKNNFFGTAVEAVTPKKVSRLVAAGSVWLRKNNLTQAPWRLDVIAIDGEQIQWLKNFGS